MPRFYCPIPLVSGAALVLPAGAARHVQVLRLQPGDPITLFNGLPMANTTEAAEYAATVLRMGRSDVEVLIGAAHIASRETRQAVHLAIGMPANDRMDWLVEKATELGVASIQPLLTERTVLRLTGERAVKKQQHWQGIAVAACEQCGRNTVPVVHPVMDFNRWISQHIAKPPGQTLVLSLSAATRPLSALMALMAAGAHTSAAPITVLSGPEGGLSPAEESRALQAGFAAATLGERVLRAETAALAALVALTLV